MSNLTQSQSTVLSELQKINATLLSIHANLSRALTASASLSTLGNTGEPDSKLIIEQRRALASAKAIVDALSTKAGGDGGGEDGESDA